MKLSILTLVWEAGAKAEADAIRREVMTTDFIVIVLRRIVGVWFRYGIHHGSSKRSVYKLDSSSAPSRDYTRHKMHVLCRRRKCTEVLVEAT